MTKQLKVLLSILLLSAMQLSPAYAAGDTIKSVAMAPVKILAFGVGVIVGTPIAVLRMTAKNTASCVQEMTGKNDNKFVTAGAYVLALPVGVFTGSLEGLYLGTKNSWMNCTSEPFGKETYSLGDLAS